MNISIPVILGTTRKNNQSKKVAVYLFEKLKSLSGINTSLLDLGEADFPVMEERLGDWVNAPGLLRDWCQRLKEADAIIIVAPEYKNGYPGSLKNFLDFLPAGIFKYKPVGISTVTSGQYGGTNCLAQLRLVALSMAGLPIPDRLMVSKVMEAFDEAGDFKNDNQKLTSDKFLSELIKYAEALRGL